MKLPNFAALLLCLLFLMLGLHTTPDDVVAGCLSFAVATACLIEAVPYGPGTDKVRAAIFDDTFDEY